MSGIYGCSGCGGNCGGGNNQFKQMMQKNLMRQFSGGGGGNNRIAQDMNRVNRDLASNNFRDLPRAENRLMQDEARQFAMQQGGCPGGRCPF